MHTRRWTREKERRKSDEKKSERREGGGGGGRRGRDGKRDTHTHTRGARRCTDGMKNEKEQLRWRLAVNRD